MILGGLKRINGIRFSVFCWLSGEVALRIGWAREVHVDALARLNPFGQIVILGKRDTEAALLPFHYDDDFGHFAERIDRFTLVAMVDNHHCQLSPGIRTSFLESGLEDPVGILINNECEAGECFLGNVFNSTPYIQRVLAP
jgi:hypothetical protein